MRSVRSTYLYDCDAVSKATGVSCSAEEDRTVQHFAQDQDINTLVRRFGITGELPRARVLPEYGDFSGVVDFKEGMDKLRAGQEAFESLPAKLRRRFHDSPAEFFAWLSSSDNLEEAVDLGILDKQLLVAQERDGGSDGASATPEGSAGV